MAFSIFHSIDFILLIFSIFIQTLSYMFMSCIYISLGLKDVVDMIKF